MLRSRDSNYGVYGSRDRITQERDAASTIEEIFIMIIFMVLAAGVRLWKLGDWSFWEDEVFSVQGAQNFPSVITVNPVVYMLIRVFTDYFGISEWSARLGPCIIGILSVPLLYWPVRRMFNAKVAMIACLFLIIHPWHIFWSQNARAYSLAFLFSGLSASLFYLALERDKVGLTILSLFMTIISIFTYAQSVMLLPVFIGYVILSILIPVGIPKGLNGKNLIVFFGPFMLALLSLFMPEVRDYIYSGWGFNELNRSPMYIIFTLVYGLSVPMAVAAFVGGIHSLIYLNRNGLFLICYAVIPLAILLAISPFLNVAGYYLFLTMPAYLFLAAFCAGELTRVASRGSKILSASVILIIFIFLLSQSYLYFQVENGGRPKWREAFQALKPRIGSNDLLVVAMPQVAEYYLREKGEEPASGSTTMMELKDVISRSAELNNLWRWKNQNVWLVLDQLSLDVHDPGKTFREWVYTNCKMVDEFPVYARVRDRTISIWQYMATGTQ